MSSFVNDTMKFKGKYSQKRILVFVSFFVAVLYGFTPCIVPTFEVKEFIFLGFLTLGGFSIYRVQKAPDPEADKDVSDIPN